MGASERDLEPLPDEDYFDKERRVERGFDASLLQAPVGVLPLKRPVTLGPDDSVTDAMRAMQRERRHCVLITEDGTPRSPLMGLFTESHVLYRIVDHGRNPAELPLREVMSAEPERVNARTPLAQVLNRMRVAGIQHLAVVDADGCPTHVASVDDVVAFIVETFPREILNLPTEQAPPSQRAREGA